MVVDPLSVPAANPSRPRTRLPQPSEPSLVWHPQCPPRTVEQYRQLALTVRRLRTGPEGMALAVTSALPEEGKTLTTVNLAASLAQSYGGRVLIVEADFRRPSILSVLGLPQSGEGLSGWLTRPASGDWPLITLSTRLSLVPAGQLASDPVALLTSPRLGMRLTAARSQFDWIIVDTPPVGLLCDASELSDSLRGFLLIVAASRAPYTAVRQAIATLGRERILGVVFNRAKDSPRERTQYSEYYRPVPFGGSDPG